MPRHEIVSPEEDLSNFYGGQDPSDAATVAATRPPPPPAPIAAAPAQIPPPPPAQPPAPPPQPPPAQVVPPPRTQAPPPPQTALPTPPVAAPLARGIDPILAALASFFIPGLGQMLTGQVAKGVAILVASVFTCAFGGLVNIIAAADAYLIAQRKQKGEAVQDWQFF